MTDPRELQAGDIVEIHAEPLSDVLWRISDTDTQSIGLTEMYAATAVSTADRDARAYAITSTEHSTTATISEVDGSHEVEVDHADIVVQ